MPQSDPNQDPKELAKITKIAQEDLGFDSPYNCRSLHLITVLAALSAAYRAGRESAKGGGQ
jgi:hypothetical protein